MGCKCRCVGVCLCVFGYTCVCVHGSICGCVHVRVHIACVHVCGSVYGARVCVFACALSLGTLF